MSEGTEHKGSKVEVGLFPGAGEVGKEIVHALAKPIFDQGLSPAVKQVGKTLETATMAVNAVLSPLRVLVYGVEQLEDVVQKGIAKKLVDRNVEEIQTPAPNVVVPAVEALRITASIPELREMFLGLIATSMDSKNAEAAHPAFVDVIKQLNPTEARILRVIFAENDYYVTFALPTSLGVENSFERYSLLATDGEVTNSRLIPAFLENLVRLDLLKVFPAIGHIQTTGKEPFEKSLIDSLGENLVSRRRLLWTRWLDARPSIVRVLNSLPSQGTHAPQQTIVVGGLLLTEFGRLLCEVVSDPS